MSVNGVRRSRPECSPSQPSETRLQSAIDFSSWIVTNYLRAGVIAEQGCKVCIKLLLFVLSSSQFTVLGRMFVSLGTVETDPLTHPVVVGIFQSIIKVEEQVTPSLKSRYQKRWLWWNLTSLYVATLHFFMSNLIFCLAIALCWWCCENTKGWNERSETSRCLIKNSILGNKNVLSSPEKDPAAWHFYRHTKAFQKRIRNKTTSQNFSLVTGLVALPWTFVTREALIQCWMGKYAIICICIYSIN